jgi:hypothetical protein
MTKMSSDTTADKTAMLLSTDWFLPYWSLIGIEAEKKKHCFQSGCREIVLQVICSVSDYYLVNFSPERLDQTRQALRALAHTCGLSDAVSAGLEELLTNRPDRDQLQKTAWMFRNLYSELMADKDIDITTKRVLALVRNRFAFTDDLPLEVTCLQSTTGWDKYTRSLTPELPASLAHLVTTSLLSSAELREILGLLDPDQRKQLHTRFRALATQRTGLDLERDWSGLIS